MTCSAKRAAVKLKHKSKSIFWTFLKYILLIELAFTILFPLFSQLATTFMNETDLMDQTVEYFSKSPSLDNYKFMIEYTSYFQGLLNSVILCTITALLTMLSAALCGYGFAKFQFKGKILMFGVVILSIVIPPQTVMLSLFSKFRYFDIFGLLRIITGDTIVLTGSFLPAAILAVTGFGFRGGLFIFLMRQFYSGLPKELLEAAYVDGASVYRTYFSIIFPLGKTLMVTVFLLSFSWMWTDTFYANILYSDINIVSRIIAQSQSTIGSAGVVAGTLVSAMYVNTATILVLIPLLVIFIAGQKFMVEGIESSGIVG